MKKRPFFLSLILGLTLTAGASAAAADTTSNGSNSTLASFEQDSLTKKDGSYWVWGALQSVPTQIPELSGVSASFGNGLVQKQDGSVWLIQYNYPNPAITVKPVQGVSDIKGTFDYGRTLAWNAEGKVFTSTDASDHWDLTSFSAVTGIDNVTDIAGYYESNDKNGDARFIFLKKDGTVWKDTNDLANFSQVQNLSNITQIAENVALKKDGTVWTWPERFSGKGDLPSTLTATQLKPLSNIKSIKHNLNSSLAIDSQSRLWFWGSTITGYSDGTLYTDNPNPVLLTGVKNVKDAFVVERTLVVLTGDNKVYTTSIERASMPANAEFKLLVSDISTVKNGPRHIIMQMTDGTLLGWGVNKNAELGYGDYEFEHTTPVPVQKPISVSLNGDNVAMTNGVITRGGQNFVPLRSVFEKLGAEITFDGTSKLATVSRKGEGGAPVTITVSATTGQTMLNNAAVTLDNKPFNVNGTLYLPLRFISEKLGATVEWQPKEERIAITLK
ncbi:hypothetical protein GCM10010912_58110 [Paenibacillus albidus]|uniref:Copper amine oxidase-like N-terminal domain-containing protein n=1 Tax=Paenibacillus albidus TaxID=2041023 RepID=A0A917FV76_9BACL|nr:stalk domain-containing protein [Paenibacillus albidus]GGG05826.1 hypothetical protein GCM10010912_58110 [Paenibacillus albidus]